MNKEPINLPKRPKPRRQRVPKPLDSKNIDEMPIPAPSGEGSVAGNSNLSDESLPPGIENALSTLKAAARECLAANELDAYLTNIVSEFKRIEQSERKQHILVEALSDSSSVLTSTSDHHEILDQILVQVGRVVAYEASTIYLIDGNQIRASRRRSNLDQKNSGLDELTLSLPETHFIHDMITTHLPLAIPDTMTSQGWIATPGAGWIRSCAAAPIIVRGEVVGFLEVDSGKPGSYSQADAELLGSFANQAAIAIHNEHLLNETQRLAITDSLTGVSDRRYFFLQAEREFERSLRYARPLAVIMLNVDRLKEINDNYGYPVGDFILRNLVQLCQIKVRQSDFIGRYGGDEFVILLPETDHLSAAAIAERLRQAIQDLSIETDAGPMHVTASLGVASLDDSSDTSLDSLIKRGEIAQDAAKHAGRNRVCS